MGNVLIGGVAALVFWGLYGPLSEAILIGSTDTAAASVVPSLRVAELFGSLITGIGGGRLLTNEVDRRVLENRNEALSSTRNVLADALKQLSTKEGGT